MELDFFLDWSLFLLMLTCFSFTDVIGGVELVHHLLLSFIFLLIVPEWLLLHYLEVLRLAVIDFWANPIVIVYLYGPIFTCFSFTDGFFFVLFFFLFFYLDRPAETEPVDGSWLDWFNENEPMARNICGFIMQMPGLCAVEWMRMRLICFPFTVASAMNRLIWRSPSIQRKPSAHQIVHPSGASNTRPTLGTCNLPVFFLFVPLWIFLLQSIDLSVFLAAIIWYRRTRPLNWPIHQD